MTASPTRSHEVLPHTADIGIRAVAADLPALFEEAALALASVASDVEPGVEAATTVDVEVAARDPAGLAFAWLGELIGLLDVEGAIVDADVERVDGPSESARGRPAGDEPWRLAGRVGLAPFDGRRVRARLDVKAATYHRLEVVRAGGGWRLTAYLDV